MKTKIVIILLLMNSMLYAQNFLDKRIIDIDYQNDLEKLIETELNQTDIQFIGFLLMENANKKINIDTLTIKGYISKINDYRLTNDYKMLEKIKSTNSLSNQEFSDSLSVFTDYEKAFNESKRIKKPLLIIFAGNLSLNSKELKKVIISGALNKHFANYVFAWLITDSNNDEGKKNLELEKDKFKTNINPFSVIIENDKILRSYEGFSKSMISEYFDFLNNRR